MILIIDNFDSFVFNLGRYIENTGHEILIVRNNNITIEMVEILNPSHIVISPGPCNPDKAGISLELVIKLHTKYPILGVCLGHQVIGQAFGAKITQAKYPMHGKASIIKQTYPSQLFEEIPPTFSVGRYHSLIVEEDISNTNLSLITTAISTNGEIMALEHKSHPTFGVQFHPESVLTEYGMQIIKNFVKI